MKIDNIHSDDRGFIKAITGELKSCPEIAIMKTSAGKCRGGCIHRKSKEHLCVIEGVINYVYGDEQTHVMLKPGQSITIEPNTPHYFLSLTDSIIIEWGAQLEEKQEKHEAFRKIVMEINNQ